MKQRLYQYTRGAGTQRLYVTTDWLDEWVPSNIRGMSVHARKAARNCKERVHWKSSACCLALVLMPISGQSRISVTSEEFRVSDCEASPHSSQQRSTSSRVTISLHALILEELATLPNVVLKRLIGILSSPVKRTVTIISTATAVKSQDWNVFLGTYPRHRHNSHEPTRIGFEHIDFLCVCSACRLPGLCS